MIFPVRVPGLIIPYNPFPKCFRDYNIGLERDYTVTQGKGLYIILYRRRSRRDLTDFTRFTVGVSGLFCLILFRHAVGIINCRSEIIQGKMIILYKFINRVGSEIERLLNCLSKKYKYKCSFRQMLSD